MIDYDATLKEFFAECIKYLKTSRSKVRDKQQLAAVDSAINSVGLISANPKLYANYNVRMCLEGHDIIDAFMVATPRDNRVYLVYNAVMNSIENLDSQFDWQRKASQDRLLLSLKQIKYYNSKNLFKDIVFTFKSPERFAVHTDVNNVKTR